MDQFKVKSRLGELTFTHEQNRVKVAGAMDALADWNYRYAEVLYGAFGHIFDVNDCATCDVYQALISCYGQNLLTVGESTKEKCKSELRSISPGFIP